MVEKSIVCSETGVDIQSQQNFEIKRSVSLTGKRSPDEREIGVQFSARLPEIFGGLAHDGRGNSLRSCTGSVRHRYPLPNLIMFRSSSVVERSAVNRIVAGPIPASGATRFAEVAQSGRARV